MSVSLDAPCLASTRTLGLCPRCGYRRNWQPPRSRIVLYWRCDDEEVDPVKLRKVLGKKGKT